MQWLMSATATLLLIQSFPARAQAPGAPSDLSPGAVGLLVLDQVTAARQSLLIQALASERPTVRAAAARVVFTQGMRGALPQVLAALASETDADAALEQVRFVAAFGAADDAALVDAQARLPTRVARQIAQLQARARGTAAAGRGPGPSTPQSGSSALRLRLASGHPHEFVTSLLTAARCDVARQKGAAAGGRVTLRPDGRVARLTVTDLPPSKECARAAQALMLTYVAAPERLLKPDEEEMLAFPFQSDFVACQDTTSAGAVDRLTTQGGITPPTQIRKVAPVYPQSAQADRVSGIVIVEALISATGCVSSAAVLRSADLRLDWAALRTIVQWQYTPTLVNGTPIPVIMTVTVTFTLN